MSTIKEVEEVARQALAMANKNASSISEHEKVCGVRYEQISSSMADIKKTLGTFNDNISAINRKVSMAIGGIAVVSLLSVIVGILYTVWKVAHGL